MIYIDKNATARGFKAKPGVWDFFYCLFTILWLYFRWVLLHLQFLEEDLPMESVDVYPAIMLLAALKQLREVLQAFLG